VSRVFSRLEKFGIEVHKVVNQVEEQEVSFSLACWTLFGDFALNGSDFLDLQRVFEEKRGEVSFLFEELTNLTAWYELFATAYEELLVEIERRHSEHKRIEEMVLAYQKELNLWFEGKCSSLPLLYSSCLSSLTSQPKPLPFILSRNTKAR